MATVASGSATLVLINRRSTPKSKPPSSPFLGKRLVLIKPFSKNNISSSLTTKAELIDTVRDVFLGVGVGLPCTVMECGDIIYRSTLPKSNGLTITAPGVALALSAISYLWATPGVAPGFFDMFVLAFVERLFRTTYRKVSNFWPILQVLIDFVLLNVNRFGFCWQDDFVLGKKLGEGAFGVVYRASLAKKPSSKVDTFDFPTFIVASGYVQISFELMFILLVGLSWNQNLFTLNFSGFYAQYIVNSELILFDWFYQTWK